VASRRSFCGRSPTLLPWPCSRSDVEHRARKNRLTPCQAGAIARRVGAKAVVPFHFSPRYEECSAALIAEVQAAWSGAPALTRGSP
jgi:ribonuclease Z